MILKLSYLIFQSTLPARGATKRSIFKRRTLPISIHAPRTGSDLLQDADGNPGRISIHAPRTGSDAIVTPAAATQYQFQSTLPARGATDGTDKRLMDELISIHAPRTGSDTLYRYLMLAYIISIHAPRTGSDSAK